MAAGSFSFLNNPKTNWFFRYKLYHLPFWFVYHYVWAVVKTGDPMEVINYIFFSGTSFKFIFYVIFQALAVYFNLYYLIPKYLEKSQFTKYIIFLILTILGTASLIVSGYFLSAYMADKSVLEIYGTQKFLYFFMTYSFPSTLASMTLAMSVKLTKNWIQTKRREQLLEKEKLETELKFLRSQFNPHFLFNTINSIFVLIHKNPDMAAETLAKFSELLRYQLYECNEPEIPLRQELTYLENFIQLEKLRHNSNNLELTFQLEQPYAPDLTIAPFVLIPFVENAFKHVSQHPDQKNWIKINLRLEQQELHFTIANSISAPGTVASEILQYRGIGLKNVQRRLDLIYPQEHHLKIEQAKDQFQVQLSLSLHAPKMAEHLAIPAEYY